MSATPPPEARPATIAEPNPALLAVRQFIETDRFFGLREAPIPREVLNRARVSSGLPAAARAASGEQIAQLEALERDSVRDCRKCRLCEKRTNTVFGAGSAAARLVFVGEGPGAEEDRQGIPFVGPAGQLLTRMIGAMGLRREEVYITNIVKCRPPNNRDPAAEEIEACRPYLYEQLRLINPEVIVALGAPAARTLLESIQGIGKLRGRFHNFQLRSPNAPPSTVPLMPTYHPAYLLRSPHEKKKAWDDLQQVMAKLGLPRRSRG